MKKIPEITAQKSLLGACAKHSSFAACVIAVIVFFLAGCGLQSRADETITPLTTGIWALSDIQPRTPEENFAFEEAIADINTNVPGIDMALVAGDIIHYTDTPQVWEWYVRTRNLSSVRHWFEIAGNHDAKDIPGFTKYIQLPLYYSVQYGNVLILCISDPDRTAEQEISQNVFEWWRDMVISNQDKIIITMTHAYLAESGLFMSSVSSRNITGSERFAEVLRNHRVDIWLAGHTHAADWLWGKSRVVTSLGGTLFINVGIMRKDPLRDSSSRVFYFAEGESNVLVRQRFHATRSFDEAKDIRFALSHPFKRGDGKPVLTPAKIPIY